MKIDTESVIQAVRARPVIWDKSHVMYRQKEAREAAWADVCRELNPDLDDYSDEDIKEIDKKIQQRWRTARDSYKKDKIAEEQPGAKKKRKYTYYGMMTFLDEDILTLGYDDIPACAVYAETDESIADTADTTVPLTHIEDIVRNDITKPLIKSAQSTLRTSVSPPPQARHNTKNISDFELELLKSLKSNQLDLEADDVAFFQSLKPALKRLTHYQKMLFRTKILQIIMDIDPQQEDCKNGEALTLKVEKP